MKFLPYPKYKASGVEWLGNVPEHWEVKRLKYCASINDEVLPETVSPDYELQYVDIGGVNSIDGITVAEKIVFENAPSRARRKVRDGDTIISTVRTYLRAIAAVKDPPDNLIVSTGFAVIRPRAAHSAFLSYALRESAFVESVVARSVGVSYPAVNASDVGVISIPLPSPDEQRAIAAFLDRETARIDTLVAKKRELIERLKEKCSALISQTVTRGLPPKAAAKAGLPVNPRLKPSGVDWLGDVPEHWEVTKFGYISAVVRGASPRPAGDPRYFDGDFIPWITVGEVTKDTNVYLTSTDTMLTEEGALNSRTIRTGTLVLTNSGATLGVPKILAITGCANDGIVAFEYLSKKSNQLFLYYFLHSLTESLRERIKQGSGQPNLNTEIVKALPVPLPPIAEQATIAAFLNKEAMKLDLLVAKAHSVIECLQEYRTALITTAVTGKIDVRNHRAA